MLFEINIKDFAIIDDLNVPFADGLNILTGETGAGKSIIVAAIGLILGEKAETNAVREGSESASVFAIFDMKDVSSVAKEMVKKIGIDCGDELIIRRVVMSGGKGRAYINDQPVPQNFLRTISPYLVDISSQHSQQLLMDTENHLSIVDQFANLEKVKNEYCSLYQEYLHKKNTLETLKETKKTADTKLEFLKFQLSEIKSAGIKIGEDVELERERRVVRHAASLFENLNESENILCLGNLAVIDGLKKVSSMLSKCAEADDAFNELVEEIKTAIINAEDVSVRIAKYKERVNLDPVRLEYIEERLYLLSQLKKKYGGTLEDVIKKGDEITVELDSIEHYEEHLNKAEEELDLAKKELSKLALKLSSERKFAAKKLTGAIQKELEELDFKRTTFHVDFQTTGEEFGPDGIDKVEFMFAPNIGEPLRPLAKIASGGELSRVTLAVKLVLKNNTNRLASTFVFDEVDSGIGGRTAEIIGRKLKRLSENRQVVCITHLPQVACFADSHFRISKEVKNGRTLTKFNALKKDERVSEIARMLGGININATTIEHAKNMLEEAGYNQ